MRALLRPAAYRAPGLDQRYRHAVDDYDRSGETEAERLDRNWDELLQELRVSQTGVQILTGFMLTLPLQPAFRELSAALRTTYAVTISLSIVATCLLIAPVSIHRLLFRQRRKESLVQTGHLLAKLGLGALALALVGVVALIFGIITDERGGLVAGLVTLVLFLGAWVGLPLAMAHRTPGGDSPAVAAPER